jgi:nucleotide-binding universal stress UspA family protein
MLDQALDAELVVLGNRGPARLRGLLGRSVGIQVVSRATCPVAVVHPFRVVAPGPSAARVVVGVDGSAACALAIGYAFQAASQRGTVLTAIHAWTWRGPADVDRFVDDAAARERRVLDEALEGWRGKFPDVSVVPKLVRADPGQALVAESAGAALVVVGSRGRRGVLGMFAGSVSRTVLRRAHRPVAVVVRPRPR